MEKEEFLAILLPFFLELDFLADQMDTKIRQSMLQNWFSDLIG